MKRLLLTLTLGLAVAPASASADDLDRLKAMWQEQRYAEVLPLLESYREEAPYGRSPAVDYMIATACCQVDGRAFDGQRYFAWMLRHYPLSLEQREQVERDWEQCAVDVAATADPSELAPKPIASATVVGGLKLYYLLESQGTPIEDKAFGTERVRLARRLSERELAERRFLPGEEAAAEARVAALAGEDFVALAEGRFVLAAPAARSGEMPTIARELRHVLDFFSRHYGIEPPEELISVYLVDYERLPPFALRLHGLELPPSSIGYSIRDDMSVVGNSLGTLRHELFHLVVRRQFGDIAPWLDEGMAALYEVAEREGTHLRGVPNWRGPVLAELWGLRPELDDLVRFDWAAFDAAEHGHPEIERQAANHATARYFALYLQERGLLAEVFRTMQAQDPLAAQNPDEAGAQALTTATGLSPEQLDQDFADWFRP